MMWSSILYRPLFPLLSPRDKAAFSRLQIFLYIVFSFIYLSTSQAILSSGMDVKDYVSDLIERHEALIYSKSYCPHCRATKELFSRYKEKLKDTIPDFEISVIELDLLPNASDATMIQDHLFELTNQRTVPNIFVGGRHLGGNSDIQTMDKTGRLEDYMIELLQAFYDSREL